MSDTKGTEREDAIYLLRSLIKLSTSLANLDELMFGGDFNGMSKKKPTNYIKFELKKDVTSWLLMMEHHTSDLMRSLVTDDDETLSALYYEFGKIDANICTGINMDRNKRQLIIFYSKLKSSLNDINNIKDNRFSTYPIMIEFLTKKVLKSIEKQNQFISKLGKDYNTPIDDIVSFIDKKGEELMFYSEKPKEITYER